jgi:hypothetical protein
MAAKESRDPSDAAPRDDAGIGASDGNSGGGAGAGIPDGDALLRDGDPAAGSNTTKDREKLFPETAGRHQPGQSSDVRGAEQPAPNGT